MNEKLDGAQKSILLGILLIGLFLTTIAIVILNSAVQTNQDDAETERIRAEVCQELTPELRASCLIAAR